MTSGATKILKDFVWPLVVALLTPALTLVGSKLTSGDWLRWYGAIPSWTFLAFFGAIFLWLLGRVLVKRHLDLRRRNRPSLPAIIAIPANGYRPIGSMLHKEVVWRVQVPAPSPFSGYEEPNAWVDIDTPPHCPDCDTELEEFETFFGSFRWSCIRCAFKVKNNMDFVREAVRAQKLAQRDYEQALIRKSR